MTVNLPRNNNVANHASLIRAKAADSKEIIQNPRLRKQNTNLNSSKDSDQRPVDANNSNRSMDSRKSCLMNNDRKSSRKMILNGTRVRFNGGLGECSEVEEDAKIDFNKKKYQNGGTKPQPILDIQIHISFKRMTKTVNIKA